MAFLDEDGVAALVEKLKSVFVIPSELDEALSYLLNRTPSATTSLPLMDGTASAGSGTFYARHNHVHPTDTSRQATLVSGTNIKTINGTSLLGSGDLTVGGGGSDVHCWYGTSATGGETLTKTVNITGFTEDDMVDGTLITIAFSYAMTAVGEMLLNVVINNENHRYPVYYLGSITSSSNPLKSSMPNEITFLFWDSVWYFVTSSRPLVPYATGNSAGVVKVGNGLTIDSDGVLSASGGSGGGNTMQLYTNSSKSVLYVDSALTTPVLEYYGYDVDAATSALQAADAIKITMSAGGVTETMLATSVFTEPIEDEYYVYFFSKGVARNISIAAE